MKPLTPLQQLIVHHLAQGECKNKHLLGERLGFSDDTIQENVTDLIHLGVPILQTTQGYHLKSFIPLNASSINEHLENKNFKLTLFPSIDSTNLFLKNLPPSASIDVCCTETQTAGRGRFSRQWFSPFGENIYCSSRIPFIESPLNLSGLSLIVGLSIIAALPKKISPEIKIKWPNDLYWRDKKLAGILIEMVNVSQRWQLIIGIGLNVNMSNSQHTDVIDKPWCSLHEMTGELFDRNVLLANLLNHLFVYVERFTQQGFSSFLHEWEQGDYLFGKKITVNRLNGTIHGTCEGINDQGHLCLKDDQGVLHTLSSGESSLRVE